MQKLKLPDKKTKIICTIGPASQSSEILAQMITNGMNIARINFAHGDFDSHRQTIANVRAAANATGQRIAIFGDLPGPKMRIGELVQESITLERGQSFSIQTETITGDAERVSISFNRLPEVVSAGDDIFLNDGFIQLEAKSVEGSVVHCTVVAGGELRAFKGVNLPGIDLGISAFTDDDREFLKFAAELGLDGVSQSFVETAADIEIVRETAASIGYQPLIIAKIERSRALENLDKILAAADALMVARGDLGVEIPIEEIAAAQKQIISKANLSGKPVITATHMLESMTTNRRPTRAEATDVANAILDGTDCVMLSGETAIGDFPAEAVAVMARIAQVTEAGNVDKGAADLLKLLPRHNEVAQAERVLEEGARDDLISYEIYRSAQALRPVLVFVPSASGATARRITRFRLQEWIVAVSTDEQACQRLQFSYGLYPEYVGTNPDSWPHYVKDWLDRYGVRGDLVLLVEGAGTLKAGDTTRLDFINLA